MMLIAVAPDDLAAIVALAVGNTVRERHEHNRLLAVARTLDCSVVDWPGAVADTWESTPCTNSSCGRPVPLSAWGDWCADCKAAEAEDSDRRSRGMLLGDYEASL